MQAEVSCAYHIGLGRQEFRRNISFPGCTDGMRSSGRCDYWTTEFAESWTWFGYVWGADGREGRGRKTDGASLTSDSRECTPTETGASMLERCEAPSNRCYPFWCGRFQSRAGLCGDHPAVSGRCQAGFHEIGSAWDKKHHASASKRSRYQQS